MIKFDFLNFTSVVSMSDFERLKEVKLTKSLSLWKFYSLHFGPSKTVQLNRIYEEFSLRSMVMGTESHLS